MDVGFPGAAQPYVDLGSASYSGSFFGAPVSGGSVDASGFNFLFAIRPLA